MQVPDNANKYNIYFRYNQVTIFFLFKHILIYNVYFKTNLFVLMCLVLNNNSKQHCTGGCLWAKQFLSFLYYLISWRFFPLARRLFGRWAIMLSLMPYINSAKQLFIFCRLSLEAHVTEPIFVSHRANIYTLSLYEKKIRPITCATRDRFSIF